MKKRIIKAQQSIITKITASIFLLLVAFDVSASKWEDGQAYANSGAFLPKASLYDIISNIMMWILAIVGIFGVVGFVIASILYLTSAGQTEQIDKAKEATKYSIIGILIALSGVILLTAINAMLNGSKVF